MKPKGVLLVDDNPGFLKAAARFLRTVPGLELVGEAITGEQALERMAALHPDLVLMDFAMPWMNGLAATLRITQQPNAPKIIIIPVQPAGAFRGHDGPAEAARAMNDAISSHKTGSGLVLTQTRADHRRAHADQATAGALAADHRRPFGSRAGADRAEFEAQALTGATRL